MLRVLAEGERAAEEAALDEGGAGVLRARERAEQTAAEHALARRPRYLALCEGERQHRAFERARAQPAADDERQERAQALAREDVARFARHCGGHAEQRRQQHVLGRRRGQRPPFHAEERERALRRRRLQLDTQRRQLLAEQLAEERVAGRPAVLRHRRGQPLDRVQLLQRYSGLEEQRKCCRRRQPLGHRQRLDAGDRRNARLLGDLRGGGGGAE